MTQSINQNICRCGHCKRAKPHFDTAAAKMKKDGMKGRLAAVDCTKVNPTLDCAVLIETKTDELQTTMIDLNRCRKIAVYFRENGPG